MEQVAAMSHSRTPSTDTTQNRALSSGLATAILLVEGFVSVSIQMIVLRQLVPVVGYSINVTSIVITTFLAALALGYRSGGRVRSGHAAKISFNLIVAALVAAIGLSVILIDAFFGFYFSLFGATLVAVALYSLLVVAPLVYLLAQTVVLLINFGEASAAAEQAGDTFHLSTIGNVVGGLVTTLVVMYYLGIAAAVFIDVTLLVVAYAVISCPRTSVTAFNSIGVLLIAFTLNVFAESKMFTRTTAYADYYLADEIGGEGRLLVVNGQNASRTDSAGIGHPYIEWFEDQLFVDAAAPRSILVLGAGGFTLGQGREYTGAITFVDVDSHLASIADEFLGSHERKGKFVAEDARAFLLRSAKHYDAIVLDTYSHRSSMPPHLVTVEFFTLLRDRLKSGGVVYMNFISTDDESYKFPRGIDYTVRSVFAQCETHRINTEGLTLYNKLYRCERSKLDDHRVIYTDKNTKTAMDAAI